jgi:biopolymer transport protein ExbD
MAVKINRGTSLDVLSMTSLIDVVFLLLIFFLVATRFAKEDRELDVVLPSASEAKPLIAKPTEVFVNIDKDGGYFIEGKFLAADEVERVLRTATQNNPLNQSVIIRADKRVQFESVVTVMNLCNRLGIADYKVTTADESQ